FDVAVTTAYVAQCSCIEPKRFERQKWDLGPCFVSGGHIRIFELGRVRLSCARFVRWPQCCVQVTSKRLLQQICANRRGYAMEQNHLFIRSPRLSAHAPSRECLGLLISALARWTRRCTSITLQ